MVNKLELYYNFKGFIECMWARENKVDVIDWGCWNLISVRR